MLGRLRHQLTTPSNAASTRWRRAALFALLAWMVLGQTGAIVHRISHETTTHTTVCVLCVAANHLAGPVTEHPAIFVPFTPALEPVDVARAHASAPSQPYRSRAPPLRS